MRGAIFTVDWSDVEARNQVQPCAHAWVSDESISAELELRGYDDPALPHHAGTNRARRIATIVRMMEAGVEFDALHVAVTASGLHLCDGHHRLRAYQFRRQVQRIRVYIAGQN